MGKFRKNRQKKKTAKCRGKLSELMYRNDEGRHGIYLRNELLLEITREPTTCRPVDPNQFVTIVQETMRDLMGVSPPRLEGDFPANFLDRLIERLSDEPLPMREGTILRAIGFFEALTFKPVLPGNEDVLTNLDPIVFTALARSAATTPLTATATFEKHEFQRCAIQNRSTLLSKDAPMDVMELEYHEFHYAFNTLIRAEPIHSVRSQRKQRKLLRKFDSMTKKLFPDPLRYRAFIIRADALLRAIREDHKRLGRYAEEDMGGHGGPTALFEAAAKAPLTKERSFDYDALCRLARERQANYDPDAYKEVMSEHLPIENDDIKIIFNHPNEPISELVQRFVNPVLYDEPKDYKPPGDAFELNGRYQIGERYFKNMSLPDVTLNRANLSDANLGGSEMCNAKLTQANLSNAHCIGCKMQAADLTGASLRGAIFAEADLTDVSLRSSDLRGVDLTGADLSGADLRYAKMHDVKLHRARLDRAKLDAIQGTLWLDENSIQGTVFPYRAPDPWSILRCEYTGTKFFFHLGLIALFLFPYLIRVMVLVTTSRVQKAVYEGILVSIPANVPEAQEVTPCLAESCKEWMVGELLLGLDRGYEFIIISLLLIGYNIGRLLLVRRIGPLRDDEERTKVAPPIAEYRSLYKAHRVVRLLMWVALGSFVIHAFSWATLIVSLPAK